MKFLADENFPLDSYKALKSEGLDIKSVVEISPGLTDKKVLSFAFREGRTLLTFDKGFGKLALLKRKLSRNGIILLRFSPSHPMEPYEILKKVFQKGLDFKGKITVITRETIRQRSF